MRDSDGTTEGLLFLSLLYAENRVYDLSFWEQNSKGEEGGLMMGSSKGGGCKVNSMPGAWAQEEWPGHVAGEGGMVLAATVLGTQLQLNPDF